MIFIDFYQNINTNQDKSLYARARAKCAHANCARVREHINLTINKLSINYHISSFIAINKKIQWENCLFLMIL